MPDRDAEQATGEDTAAFQRFYAAGQPAEQHGFLYRLLVGWWRDRP